MERASGTNVELLVASQLLQPLTKFAAFVAGLTALAYVFGYAYLLGYLPVAQAGWALGLYSPLRVMQVSQFNAFIAITVLGMSMLMAKVPEMRRIMTGWRAVMACVLGGAGLIFVSVMEGSADALYMAFVVTTVIANFAAMRLVTHAMEGTTERFAVFYALFLTTLSIFAFISGQMGAKRDFGSESSLPVALLDGDEWRLIAAVDSGTALLYKSGDVEDHREFRVVPFASIDRIWQQPKESKDPGRQ